MGITVAFRQRPRPEHLGAMIAAAGRGLGTGRDAPAGRQRARLFQRLNDSHDLLGVADWEGRGPPARTFALPATPRS